MPRRAHQFGQHLGARHHRDAQFARRLHLRVGGRDRAGHHQHVGAFDVRGRVALVDGRPQLPQVARGAAFGQVGSAHGEPLVDQHLGNAAHAGAADTDEVHPLDAPHGLQM
jgi:hypothetical protein